MEVKNESQSFQWIINEGLLRDEGTLFGIAGADIKEKITAIHDYYRIRKASAEARREQLEKEMNRVQSELAAVLAEMNDPDEKGKTANLVPVILQLFLYGGVCYFNFFLESYWLSPVIHSAFICAGLYLFGLFSVFLGRSIMYNAAGALTDGKDAGEKRETWKIYLEELGVPLVVSSFICVLSANAHPAPISIIAALFFFILFLLGGKGLVNTFFRARAELGHIFKSIGRRKERKRKEEKLKAMQGEQVGVLATIGELDGEEEYKIHILTSEYRLAFESRQLAASVSVKKSA
jgi:hypothetical protein